MMMAGTSGHRARTRPRAAEAPMTYRCLEERSATLTDSVASFLRGHAAFGIPLCTVLYSLNAAPRDCRKSR